MKSNQIVTPSSQVDSTLPRYVYENYTKFVNFMTASSESAERVGFGQDILQNLQKYRNFDTYKNQIVQFGNLKDNISATDDELTLEDGFGFPDANGVLLINDEVILYQSKKGNVFSGLERGASGTKVLPTFRSKGTYVVTKASSHNVNAKVTNLSVLFLVSMLDNIHESFTPAIESARISPEVNRSSLLQNIKDFFASKGSKLGVQALFRMLFAENDVDVTYPGDRMIVPSKSSWYESVILRTIPVPDILCDPLQKKTTPDKVIGSAILYKSYSDDKVYARGVCDYVSSYPYESEIQYELFIDDDNIQGQFFANPKTKLTRGLNASGSLDDRRDVTTITVESTNGFPESGVVIIDSEMISYTSKTFDQFLGCKRGYVGVEANHAPLTEVYGPYYIETSYTDDDGEVFYSRSFPLGLVDKIEVRDPGVLHRLTDEVFINKPGDVDNREQATTSFLENSGFLLVEQEATLPSINYVGNFSAGVSGVYYDDDYVFVASSTLPYYSIGTFSTDNSVGPNLTAKNAAFVIPRRHRIEDNYQFTSKGSGTIGVFADGVPAISNEGDKFYHGSIIKFNINNQGANYNNPTVLINGSIATSVATVSSGLISSISGVGDGFYTSIPTVKITSGEGAVISLTFDKYGRVLTGTVVSGGQYYNDVPVIKVSDASGRGKGAVVTCTVSGGSVVDVKVSSPGIDYVPGTTGAVVVPIGSGAEVDAEIEYYVFDRVKQIIDNPNQNLDSGNGFVFDDVDGVKNQFGYIGIPFNLTEELGVTSDDVHSPILGWAFDGNPIYGPNVFTNRKNSDGGVSRAYSSYVLSDDRTNIKSTSGTVVGTNPPSIGDYPMGTFLEDYTYDPGNATFGADRISSQDNRRLRTEVDNDFVLSQIIPGILLDETNGRVMNTPEFPEELYPDGVFCYITTSIIQTPIFPYIVGAGFQNLPVSQNVQFKNGDEDIITYGTESTDNKLIVFDLKKARVNRESGMTSTNDGVSLAIDNISSGSVSKIFIDNALPATTTVGDILRFDNSDTNGSGAEGKVSFINGVSVNKSFGQEIVTKMLSHRQRINLRFTGGDFTFAQNSFIRTSSGAEATVDSYDSSLRFLDVTVSTEGLIKFGDTFTDNKGRSITIPASQDGNDATMFDNISGSASTFISYSQPTTNEVNPGDLWWSTETGRLFVYYNDGDTSQWVATQPIGIRPLAGASNVSIGQPGPVSQTYNTPQAEGKVTISTMAPSQRSDGSANQRGDLWWSSHSGILYIWNQDKIADYEQGELEWTGEWVTTDPSGMSTEYDASNFNRFGITTPTENVYEATQTVIIKETAPTTMQDGSALFSGALWWSPMNGRLFIYYTDTDSSQWVITNPYGILTSKYANNTTVIGDGGSFPDYISLLPTTTSTNHLWFESLKYFEVGDTIEFRVGAPGIGSLVEQAKIEEKLGGNQILVTRGTNGTFLEIPHGTRTFNVSRGLYTVDTVTPHRLRNGNHVVISGSNYLEVNGNKIIENAGVVEPAQGNVTIINGEITAVNITDPGRFYTRDFYINFIGGGGQGALAFATIAPLVNGGGIEAVAMLEGGVNYTSQPTIVFGDETPNTRFTFFTEKGNSEDSGVTYITDTVSIESTPAVIDVTSPGVGYESMPIATGLLKKQGDRATTRITMSGTAIGSVEVVNGGLRYVNPVAIFTDATGSGSGAAATVRVENGIVETVTVTSAGSGYVEPFVELIEGDGKFIPLTNDIGQIKSVKVLNSGRNISSDETLRPEVQIQTRLIVSPANNGAGQFTEGLTVFQGTSEYKFAEAIVVSYDSERQILFVEKIDGEIKENEIIQSVSGIQATVLREGQSEVRVGVNGTSKPEGKFIDDTSIVSAKYAVVQDSEYYQYFSYSISSTIQEVLYKDFVKDIIHPAGFVMFSEMKMTDNVNTPIEAFDVTFAGAENFTGKDVLLRENEEYLMTEGGVFIDLQFYEFLVEEGSNTQITTEDGLQLDMTTQGVWEAFVNESGDHIVTEVGKFISSGRFTESDGPSNITFNSQTQTPSSTPSPSPDPDPDPDPSPPGGGGGGYGY